LTNHPEFEVMADILPYVDTNWTKTTTTTKTSQAQHQKQAQQRRRRSARALPDIVNMLYQSAGHGAAFYNQHRLSPELEPDYDHVFRPCWQAFFTPSPAVQSHMDQQMEALHLQPNNYVAVHIRSQYHNYNGDISLRTLVRNAMNCASQLTVTATTGTTGTGTTGTTGTATTTTTGTTEPIFVATDSTTEPIFVATDSARAAAAVSAYGARHYTHFLQRDTANSTTTLHLDRGSAYLSKNASAWTMAQNPADYYDTFVDLYLLAGSRCITYHVGGYGRWANLLSSNLTCELNHLKNKCSWTEPTITQVLPK
jgi:hypothetical protein